MGEKRMKREDETNCGVPKMNVPVESSREPEHIVYGSESVGPPTFFELGLLNVNLGAVCVDSLQRFLPCAQKSSPLLQTEELEENVCKIEPAGGLQ